MAEATLLHPERDGARPAQGRFEVGPFSLPSADSQGPEAERWVAGDLGAARITKVGLWLTLLTLVLSVAAANTGNNSLYLVVAGCFSVLVVAWWFARANVQGHQLKLQLPDEIYAGSPAQVDYSLRRTKSGNSTDLLLLIDGSRSGSLVRSLVHRPRLPRVRRRGDAAFVDEEGTLRAKRSASAEESIASGDQQLLFLRRGLRPIGQAKVLSLYPMGLFRRQISFGSSQDVVVLPEIYSGLRTRKSRSPRGWRHPGARLGHTEDLYGLRDFRSGDDPRSIHWKQTARNTRLIYQERSEDEARRVTVMVDSSVPQVFAEEDARFERLISEAATACVEYLDHGYEVELRLREGSIGFGAGAWQRRRILEALALLQPVVGAAASDTSAWDQRVEANAALRFSLSPGVSQGASTSDSSDDPAGDSA